MNDKITFAKIKNVDNFYCNSQYGIVFLSFLKGILCQII